jgi:hypothetical protein
VITNSWQCLHTGRSPLHLVFRCRHDWQAWLIRCLSPALADAADAGASPGQCRRGMATLGGEGATDAALARRPGGMAARGLGSGRGGRWVGREGPAASVSSAEEEAAALRLPS